MWRTGVVRAVLIGLIVSLSVSTLEAQNSIAAIDLPVEGETVSGLVLVRGFALDLAGVSRVDLYVDDRFQHSVNTTIPRIDVTETHPDWKGIHETNPGYQTAFLSTRFSNGAHIIHIRVIAHDGRAYDIGRRTILIDNTINQLPFGYIDFPGVQGVYDVNGSFPVSGWVVDVDGIARVDVQIDNLNMQAAIYGGSRPDVANTYPDFPQALFSGFISNIDTTRVPEGVHSLTVRATDRLGLSRVIGRRSIQIFNSTNNLRPFGSVEEPRRDSVLYGTNCSTVPACPPGNPGCVPFNPTSHITLVRGWALDLGSREDLGRVAYAELLIDGARWASTDDCAYNRDLNAYTNCYGLPRFDVQRFYPTYPDSPRSGFQFTLDVGGLMARGVRPGNHVLKVRVGDQEQTFADLPNTSGIPVFFACAEANQDFASIGYIEQPINFDYLKGTVRFSGWALDENGGVQNVEIYVDGNLMGLALYGGARADVQAVYPTIPNSGFSAWQFNLDTTQLSDSRHRLTVRVLDRAGNRTEIGSTDFYTDNPD